MQGRFRQPALSAARALTLVGCLVGIGVAVPVYADQGQSLHKVSESRADDRIEKRIADLHTRLGITSAQEQSWGNVATVMRDNANTMTALVEERSGKTMTAVDDLKSYGQIAAAHADGIQKFTPVFSSLYDSMSDEQKRNADSIFRDHSHKALKHMAARGG
jgi:hypothetical protein